MRLKGKVALITGAGKGLGRAAAVAFAREGASVAVLSRTVSELQVTARMVRSAGGEALAFEADVSKPSHIERVLKKTLAGFGRIDILMNNAAIVGPVGPLHLIPPQEWKAVINVNLTGAFLCTRAVLPSMIERRSGKIINVTSGLGELAMPRFSGYAVSKAGLNHLTRVLAEEVREHGIQVNGLDPGMMDTSMQDEVRGLGPSVLGEEVYGELREKKLRGLLKPPEQVARLAVYLASDESGGLTGEIGTERHYQRFGYEPLV